ncbi:hypothetical protein CL634_01855 [bacterium]|nr:hypothetical protein [bacterium]
MALTDRETFNLSAVGAPELQVTYKRPGMIPYDEAQAWLKTHPNYSKKTVDYETLEDLMNDTDFEFAWVMSLVENWNLCKPGTNELLPTPDADNAVWNKIPGLYLAYIVKMIKADPTGSDFLVQSLNRDLDGLKQSILTLKP